MDWESKGLENYLQIICWPALPFREFPPHNYKKEGLAPTTLFMCSLQGVPRSTAVPGTPCEFISPMFCMWKCDYICPAWWQRAGRWGHLTSVFSNGWLWQKHPLGHGPSWHRKVPFLGAVSPLSFLYSCYPQLWEQHSTQHTLATSTLMWTGSCEPGMLSRRLNVLQRTAVHWNAKSLVQGSISPPPQLLMMNISAWYSFCLSSWLWNPLLKFSL